MTDQSPRTFWRPSVIVASLALLLPCAAGAQILQPPYNGTYSLLDLGQAPGIPANYGGLTFPQGDPNTLLMAGGANGPSGAIYSIGVVRDIDNHITAFAGTAQLVAAAPQNDGGLAYGPDGVLFYTRYPNNEVGQIKPGSAIVDKVVNLAPLGVAGSTGGLNFVPVGLPGAGRLKITSYNGGTWYDVPFTADGSGTYDLGMVTTTVALPSSLEGFVYVPLGSPNFSNPSVLVAEYGSGIIGAYEVNAIGDPVAASRTSFITGLTGAEGAVIDALTGDFLFSTYGGGTRVIAVRGFAPVTTTLDTTTTTFDTTTTTLEPTTTSTTTTTLPAPCSPSPLSGCRNPTQEGKSALILKGNATPSKNVIVWKWGSGAATTAGEFGTPLTTSDYTLCLYDDSGDSLTAIAPAGGDCGGKPCWKATSAGFVYKDKQLTPDGILVTVLKSGAAGKAKITVKGKGANLDFPSLPLDTPVTVQLHRSDGGPCWEASYSTPIKNDGSMFKSKSE